MFWSKENLHKHTIQGKIIIQNENKQTNKNTDIQVKKSKDMRELLKTQTENAEKMMKKKETWQRRAAREAAFLAAASSLS